MYESVNQNINNVLFYTLVFKIVLRNMFPFLVIPLDKMFTELAIIWKNSEFVVKYSKRPQNIC